MSSRIIKTNNDLSLIEKKIQLRIDSISDIDGNIKVLDLFGGEGVLWDNVKNKTGKNIKVLSIDKNKYKKVQLQGDNMKFIQSLTLNDYDVIDIDAWGSPFNQLEKIFENKYTGIVHCTFIQSVFGRITNEMLYSVGFTENMVKKIPTLFSKNALSIFKQYLSINNVKEINILTKKRKIYLWFYLHNSL